MWHGVSAGISAVAWPWPGLALPQCHRARAVGGAGCPGLVRMSLQMDPSAPSLLEEVCCQEQLLCRVIAVPVEALPPSNHGCSCSPWDAEPSFSKGCRSRLRRRRATNQVMLGQLQIESVCRQNHAQHCAALPALWSVPFPWERCREAQNSWSCHSPSRILCRVFSW